MTAATTSTRTALPAPQYAARVALTSPTGRGLLDGAWWPRSRDLAAELPELDPHTMLLLPYGTGRRVHGSRGSTRAARRPPATSTRGVPTAAGR
ncbi:DUF5994 family protein [Streptomyces sp. BH055]|uniref:DUF5994 family protein n=1 Tax=Streptomyces sp. BH055 TaxID=3401173 RepID=UPI003BB6184B